LSLTVVRASVAALPALDVGALVLVGYRADVARAFTHRTSSFA
jgi:hypothetical protein